MAASMRQRRRLSAFAVSAILAFSALPLFAGAVAADATAGNEADFRTQWANASETLITLTDDITLSCNVEDPGPTRASSTAQPIVVDGAGFTLHNPCVDADALIQEGAGLLGTGLVTLRNLTLTGIADSGDGLNTEGAAVVEAGSAVTGHGNDGIETQLDATIVGSTVSGNGNNGVESEANVAVSGGSTISGNGDHGIEAGGGPLGGNVTVSGSTISDNGESGIDASSGIDAGLNVVNGDVTVSASTISGNGDGDFGDGSGIDAEGDVSVTGPTTISNNDDVGILADGAITVSGATVSGNGDVNENGGEGIRSVEGAVTVTDSTVSENDEEGIRSDGDAAVTDSTISDNGFDRDGVRAGGDASILRSTISDNGDDCGSGVSANDVEVVDSTITGSCTGIDAANAIVTNSTIMDNGTGVFAEESVTASHATITDNVFNISNPVLQTIHLFGTVLIDAEVNCDGEVDDQGFNFVDDDSCGDIASNTADPTLGDLANNGGPTFTRLPGAGSPLLDAIPADDCEETTEQRGIALRPQGAGCDIGSVEVVVPPPGVSVGDAADVVEGNTGTTVEASFTVTLSKSWTRTVTVDYATANGSATAPVDYLSETGTVTFAPGDTSETITITVVGDNLDEPNETFVVNLSAPVEATIADAQGTATILDDDGPAALSINDVTVAEGNSGTVNAVFTVRLLPASSNTVTVAYATANGTATAPADYESATGTLTFVAGDTEETITVRVAGDTLAEANETFVVNLSTPTGGAIISDSQGTGTILDDDTVRAGTLGATSLPDTGTGGGGLDGSGAAGAAIGLVVVSLTVLIRERRRRTIRTR